MAIYREITCIRCGDKAIRATSGRPVLCIPCTSDHERENASACSKVGAAVKKGSLPRAKDCICTDCGAPATEYDHRDYTRPLDVEPVCRSCNHKRGIALDSRLRSIPAPVAGPLLNRARLVTEQMPQGFGGE